MQNIVEKIFPKNYCKIDKKSLIIKIAILCIIPISILTGTLIGICISEYTINSFINSIKINEVDELEEYEIIPLPLKNEKNIQQRKK